MARNSNYTAKYFKLWSSMNLNNYIILYFSKESLRKTSAYDQRKEKSL